ncbi:MAG: DHH family phosphoesterase [Thermoproteota archaeon]|nr:DHH family phosphoesterase [Thermoproteota archaeon]
MSTQEEKLRLLLDSASKAAELILECVEKGGLVHVASHLDADGLAAAGIIGKALARLGARFRIRTHHWIDEEMLKEIAKDNPALTIFTDLGSGYLDLLREKLSNYTVVVLDHHKPIGETPSNFIHVNPHLHGIDGARDLSGAGVTYLVTKAINKKNIDSVCIAVVGSLGDMQDKYPQRALGGVNDKIVKEAVDAGYLTVEKDLIFFGRETRPIHKALAYTTKPYLPGISGEEDKSLAFLASLGITPKHGDKWRALRDLSEKEKTKLASALADYLVSQGFSSNASNLIGHAYTLTHEEPWTPLRDAREFSVLLNAAGRTDQASVGVAICMGDRGDAYKQAEEALENYRRTINKYLGWLLEKPERIKELDSIYLVQGENFISEKVIGTLSSILLTSLPNHEKPVVAYAKIPSEDFVKVSARTLDILTNKGFDLGEIMRVAAEKNGGRGGGHNIAAGAQIPVDRIDSFIEKVDKLVTEEIEGIQSGS